MGLKVFLFYSFCLHFLCFPTLKCIDFMIGFIFKSLSSVKRRMWPVAEHSFKNQIYPPCPEHDPSTVTLYPGYLIMQTVLLPFPFCKGGQKARKAVDVGALIKSYSM